jgi:hypothetical protein
MKQSLTYRSAWWMYFGLLSTMLVLPLGRADEPEAIKGTDSPQALVATYRSAVARKDWKTCYRCYDAKRRASFLSLLFYGIAVAKDAKTTEICERHADSNSPRVDEPAIPQVRSDSRMAKELHAYQKIQKQIRDLPSFVEEVCRRFDAMGQETFRDLGDVKDISIRGDDASGYVNPSTVIQRFPAIVEEQQPVHFYRTGGKWYLTLPDPPPLLSVSERAAKLQAEVESFALTLGCSYGRMR